MPPSPPSAVSPSHWLPASGGSNYAFHGHSNASGFPSDSVPSHYGSSSSHAPSGSAANDSSDHQAMAVLEQLRRRSDSSYEGNPACDNCRRRKTKCDRQQPVCGRCAKLGRNCTRSDVLMRRGPPSNKERAAYQAAGLEIPSLKYRHRARRAQSLASNHQPSQHTGLQLPHAAFHTPAFHQANLSSTNHSMAYRPGVSSAGTSGASNLHLYTNSGSFAELPGHQPGNTLGNPHLTGSAFQQPFSPSFDSTGIVQERPSVDSLWERDNNNYRRSYYALDDNVTTPTTFGNGYSPMVSATSSEPAQRRWTMLPATTGFDQTVEPQVLPEGGAATQRVMTQFDQRDSLSSGASISSISPRSQMSTRAPANRFGGDYLNPSYHPNPLPYYGNTSSHIARSQASKSAPSPASSNSFAPPVLGHDAVATGIVVPTSDEHAYSRTDRGTDYGPNYSSMRSLPTPSFSDIGSMPVSTQSTPSNYVSTFPSHQPMLTDYALPSITPGVHQNSNFPSVPHTRSAHAPHQPRAQQGPRELGDQHVSVVPMGSLDSTDVSTMGQDPRFHC